MSSFRKLLERGRLEKWYYDACTLDFVKIYGEIIDKKHHPKEVLWSHLALGEAYGRCFEKGREATAAFLNLMEQVTGRQNVKIIGNDDVDKVFDEVRNVFSELSICDSIHLATAIKNQCRVLRTIDRDLYGLDPKKVSKLASDFGCSSFSITNEGIERH